LLGNPLAVKFGRHEVAKVGVADKVLSLDLQLDTYVTLYTVAGIARKVNVPAGAQSNDRLVITITESICEWHGQSSFTLTGRVWALA
jgi:hypothetical protein